MLSVLICFQHTTTIIRVNPSKNNSTESQNLPAIPQITPLFPHAILHESSITFLGFGLSTEQPAIGVILSESMRYLIMGKWWLAVFPGMMLVLTVVLFEKGGTALRQLLDPGSVHK